MTEPEPTNWFALLDLLIPFGVVLIGLAWYDHKLRRARRQARLQANAGHEARPGRAIHHVGE